MKADCSTCARSKNGKCHVKAWNGKKSVPLQPETSEGKPCPYHTEKPREFHKGERCPYSNDDIICAEGFCDECEIRKLKR